MLYRHLCALIGLVFGFLTSAGAAERVWVENHQLVVDGQEQPQLFGAELQYFRLRGGYGPNVPREKVIETWKRALDSMVKAKMNMISFYIPWDFHEYKEGHFDFTGTVDEDRDGHPDYPSRDIFTFLRMIQERGITRIMVRPGPYINAEWGFLGFGAIPLWFHEKYPDSHMRNPWGQRTKLYDYHNPDLHRHTKIWFETVYRQVISKIIGPGKPVLFLQLDNETNFMWQSVFNHDYGERAKGRYRKHLEEKYKTIAAVNKAHERNWKDFSRVHPPSRPGRNATEDLDWYRFQDHSILEYLRKLRTYWEELGVKEPQVLFTLAESYNAQPHGLLPNFHYRNLPNWTGLSTVNLYPKTREEGNGSLLNFPFKSDHDVKAMDAANDPYFKSPEQWLLGPEIQGGWWRGTHISPEARRQTYLTTLGHGLKALLIYYYTEGYNWQSEWAYQQIEPIYQRLLEEEGLAGTPMADLQDAFWGKLQATVDNEVMVGFEARHIMNHNIKDDEILYFDAPLDHEAKPRPHFSEVLDLGQKVIDPYKSFLAKATAIEEPIVLMKDATHHGSAFLEEFDYVKVNADWHAGLLGYLLQENINPMIQHWGWNPANISLQQRIIFHQDVGVIDNAKVLFFQHYLNRGGTTVVSFMGDALAKGLGLQWNGESVTAKSGESFRWYLHETKEQPKVSVTHPRFFTYDLSHNEKDHPCRPIFFYKEKIVGLDCRVGDGRFVQIGAMIYDIFNSDYYAEITDSESRTLFLKWLLEQTHIKPQIQVVGTDRVVAFGRRVDGEGRVWVTVKSGRNEPVSVKIKLNSSLFNQGGQLPDRVIVSHLYQQSQQNLSMGHVTIEGVSLNLAPNESTVLVFQPIQPKR